MKWSMVRFISQCYWFIVQDLLRHWRIFNWGHYVPHQAMAEVQGEEMFGLLHFPGRRFCALARYAVSRQQSPTGPNRSVCPKHSADDWQIDFTNTIFFRWDNSSQMIFVSSFRGGRRGLSEPGCPCRQRRKRRPSHSAGLDNSSILFCWLFTIRDRRKKVCFQQTHNQGSRQLLLTVSLDLRAQRGTPYGVLVSL